ncbi:MAG: hypothetical protein KDD44_10105 [Bdellovibrionales bacterium]|nr:hypothetical protein [Bdellovibrionales bacterium]
MKFRGYAALFAALLCAAAFQQVAFLELALLTVILAISKDGPWLLGDLGERMRRLPIFTSTFGKALVMAVPVKTLTALIGARGSVAFGEVAVSATFALLLLGLSLGLLAAVLNRVRPSKQRPSRPTPHWVALVDLGLILLLLMLGDDGPILFGPLAERVQSAFPLLHEPWARGMLAIVPVKTVTTLIFAEPDERRRISAHGSVAMGVLATLTFVSFWTSSIAPIALATTYGIGAAFFAFISLEAYKQVVKEESKA